MTLSPQQQGTRPNNYKPLDILLVGAISLLCFDKIKFELLGKNLILGDLLGCALILSQGVAISRTEALRKIDLLFLGYPAWLTISAIGSREPGQSLGAVLTGYYLALLAISVRRATSTPAQSRSFRTAWLALSWLTCLGILLGLASYILGLRSPATNPWLHIQGNLPPWLHPRIEGWFNSPNLMCNVLIVALGMAYGERKPEHRKFIITLVLLSIFTFSSGLGAIFLLVATMSRRATNILLASGVAFTILLLNSVSFTSLTEHKTFAPSHRVRAWAQTLEQVCQSPFLGQGPGQVDTLVHFTYPDGQATYIADPHNTLLSIAAQAGIPGLLIFLLILNSTRLHAGAPDRPITLAILLAILYHGLTGSFEDSRHIWMTLGFLTRSQGNKERNNGAPLPNQPPSRESKASQKSWKTKTSPACTELALSTCLRPSAVDLQIHWPWPRPPHLYYQATYREGA